MEKSSRFNEALIIRKSMRAGELAAELFQTSFSAEFPQPHSITVLGTEIGAEHWHQYVAMYSWADGREECVGFGNWIRYKGVYLEGGLAVKKDFYRRLSKQEFDECRRRGGVAQILMEQVANDLNDGRAWFGYCGDAKSMQVCSRVGYSRTDHPYLIVKWMLNIPDDEKRKWIEEISKIGPF